MDIILVGGFVNGEHIFIGSVYNNGQNLNSWCDSKIAITDLNMYSDMRHVNDLGFYTQPTCFGLFVTGGQFKLLVHLNEQCIFSSLNT
jgi:hypothetical protein